MKNRRKLSHALFSLLYIGTTFGLLSGTASAQIGTLLWEDNFNSFNTNIWTPDVGDGCDIGLCGWGNAELEYYSPNNVSIEAIPGEPGNTALVFEAKSESAGTRAFTSGKVTSDGKLSVQYGMIETRIRVPDLNTGLWPAAWLLGTANLSWPAKGEIDMMEMGHAAAERANQGYPGANINSYVGANAIFANPDGSPGSIAFDVNYNQPYVSSSPMSNGFVIYRLYWEPSQMRYTVIDNGIEYDLYTNPLPIDPSGVTGVFSKPFFFLLNLAVGGNFTDAATNAQVSAPLPAKMYIDYLRVYEWNGYGTIETDYGQLLAESGTFGVFTDNTPTNNSLTLGLDAEVYGWGGTVQAGNTVPNEGTEVIAWETVNPNSWFGGGVVSLFGKNMSAYVDDGSL
ncbi:MAG: glycoside hydrolase family 16 protein, partial [Bacteroidota bacterium]